MTEPSAPQHDDLAATGRELRASVEELAAAVVGLSNRVTRNRKAVAYIATSLLIDVVLTIIVSLSLVHESQLAQTQADTTNGALCPLYDYLVRAYHPELQAPDKLEAYNQGYQVIRQGAVALHCATG